MHQNIEKARELARQFHETYERLAPSFGYETRADTRAFDPESPNGRLMTAVCAEIAALSPAVPEGWVLVPRELLAEVEDQLVDLSNEKSSNRGIYRDREKLRDADVLQSVRLLLNAAPAPQVSVCTCPSGDGSLRWPCPKHPPEQPQQPAACGTCGEIIRPDAMTGTACRCAQQPAAVARGDVRLREADVQWIVNDNAELGVRIGGQCFFLYKGSSLIYESGKHDDGTRMHIRTVGKREFGECCHPINHGDYTKIGTVSLEDSDRWEPMPAAPETPTMSKSPELTVSMCKSSDYAQGWNDCREAALAQSGEVSR